MEFYSGQPENPAASVRDYCTGVLRFISFFQVDPEISKKTSKKLK